MIEIKRLAKPRLQFTGSKVIYEVRLNKKFKRLF